MTAFKSGIFLALLGLATVTYADTLELRDGQKLEGKLVSQNAEQVVFEVAGQKLTFDSSKVKGVSFGDAEPAKDTAAKPTAGKVVPAGTRIVARTQSAISSKQHKAGHKFTATLEADLVANGQTLVPQGAKLYGVVEQSSQSRRAAGQSAISIRFTDIMIDGQMKPISTSSVQAASESTGKKTVGRTARWAAVGGLANGSKGAEDAAKAALGVSILTSGNTINIPASSLLEFQLTSELAL